jgi:type VI secretion system protein ImpC
VRHVDDEPTVAEYAGELRHTLAIYRIAQYLKCIVRDRAKSFHGAEEMQRFLSKWICEYVLPNPEEYPPEYRIKRPLSFASIEVEEDVGRGSGAYRCELTITPHIDFGRSTVPLRTSFFI